MWVIKAGIHQTLVKIANKENPDQSLIWVCAVCQDIFCRQLVFKILDYLLYPATTL